MDKFEMSDFQRSIMAQRYALPTEKTWEEVARRVANHLSKAEHNGDMVIWEKRFNWVLSNGYYFPGGRVLYGSGRRLGGLLNCFCKDVEDNRHSIAKLMHDMYLISTFGGGVGTNYSNIRPKGDPIQGVQGVAPGVVSEIRKIDAIGNEIKSGGGRRVALIANLDIPHPDVQEFLNVKLTLHELNNHNISVNYFNKFFEAVKADKDWVFEFRGQVFNRYLLKRTSKGIEDEIYVVATSEETALKTAENFFRLHWEDTFEVVGLTNIKAKELWDTICKNAVESGEPGFLFVDNIKNNFATKYFEEYSSCNPCVVGDTLVAVADGRDPIKISELSEIGEDTDVYCVDNNGSLSISKMENIRKTGKMNDIYRVSFSDGTYLDVNDKHKFIMKDGSEKTCIQLKNNDSIHSMTMWKQKLWNKPKSQYYNWISHSGNRRTEHNIQVELRTGVKIGPDECVHHIDLNGLNNHRVVSVEKIGVEDVYCGNVLKHHNFFCIGNPTVDKNGNNKYSMVLTRNCTEALLPDDGNCNLGSINLGLMYDEVTDDVNWSLLEKVIGIAVRMLDNVLTMNVYPTPETKIVAERSRRIGLGVMGLHHLLIKLGYRYGSEESLEFIERLFTTIRNEAFKASIDTAKTKGSFPEFNYEKYIDNNFVKKLPTRILKSIQKYGIRNAVILSIAPTGTISMIAGTSSGIEPIFSPMYRRKYRVDNVIAEEIVVDPMFARAVNSGNKWEHIVGAYDVTPEEHIAVQAAIQDYVDQAISKCVIEGTLINTNFGTIKIEDIAKTKNIPKDTFTTPHDGIMVLDENGCMKKVVSVYNGGRKKCYSIKFSNGREIKCSLNHKFKTPNGWEGVTSLDIGDRVFYNTTPMLNDNLFEYKKIDRPNNWVKDYPTHMDEDFALFLGMWLADGYTNKNSVGIVEKNHIVGELIDNLFVKCFGVEPKTSVDKRSGVKSHHINSRVMVKHFRDKFGSNCVDKVVPGEIMCSNNLVKKHFLRGLTLDGYKINDTGKLVIYEGYSKDIAEKCISICAGLGYQYYFGEKKVKTGLKSNKSYGISIYYNDGCDLIPIESHKLPSGGRKWIQRFVKEEDREKLVELIGVGTTESYKRRNFKRSMNLCGGFMVEESLKNLGYSGYDSNVTCVKVVSIECVGVKQVWDISVEDTHSYLIDGIVSHNTINLPEDYDYHNLMELILNYSDSLKGLTLYRAGSRANEPLVAIPTTEENVELYAKNKDLVKVVNEECKTGSCEV